MTKKCPLRNFKPCLRTDCAWYLFFEHWPDISGCVILCIVNNMDSIPGEIKNLKQ